MRLRAQPLRLPGPKCLLRLDARRGVQQSDPIRGDGRSSDERLVTRGDPTAPCYQPPATSRW